MNIDPRGIKRGDVWLINLDPTVGAEIRKTRPAVIISSDGVGKLPLKVIVPLTEWDDAFPHRDGMCGLIQTRPTA